MKFDPLEVCDDWFGLEITMQFWRIHLTMFVVIDECIGDS
jgi:hypothetical protein